MSFIEFETEEAYNEAINAKVSEAVTKAIDDKNQGWLPDRLKKAHDKAVEETKALYADYDQLKEAGSNIAKERESWETERKKWQDAEAEYKAKLAGIEGKEADIMKLKAAMRYGLSEDDASRLRGSSEKEINDDAKAFADAHKTSRYPARSPESKQVDGVTAAFLKMNPNIKL